MKIALACTCSIGYTGYLLVLLKSIIASNKGKQYPFFVFYHTVECDDGYRGLSDWDIYQIKNTYGNINFIEIDRGKYVKYDKGIKYYSLEAFGLEEFDKVIYFGADMLNIAPLDEMINFEGDLCMTKEKRRVGTYNNGGMIISKKFLSVKLRDELIEYDPPKNEKYFGTDQALLCHYFEGCITEAPQQFNTLVTEADLIKKENVINYHYIIKPNTFDFVDRCGRELLDLWQYYWSLNIDKNG